MWQGEHFLPCPCGFAVQTRAQQQGWPKQIVSSRPASRTPTATPSRLARAPPPFVICKTSSTARGMVGHMYVCFRPASRTRTATPRSSHRPQALVACTPPSPWQTDSATGVPSTPHPRDQGWGLREQSRTLRGPPRRRWRCSESVI